MNIQTQIYDFFAIGAHADDIELGMGASIAKMTAQGQKGLLIDLTQATAASRGTPEGRKQEALLSAQILGVDRVNLGFQDAFLQTDFTRAVTELVKLIRIHKPKILFAPVTNDYHPDHNQCHLIVKEAWYKAGLGALWPEYTKYRPERLFYYAGALSPKEQPAFLISVDEFWHTRQQALAAYGSQFDQKGQRGQIQTAVSSKQFQEDVIARHRALGAQARCTFAEAFWYDLTPTIDNPFVIQGITYG